MEEVKIVYCYDEHRKAIHYSQSQKGNKYYCIDCGSELTCKDGNVYRKHLAHLNVKNCGGTGESIFHKHWKENLFKAGMFINIANKISFPDNVEILEVLNEVSLNKRYNKKWDKEIIVDVLLITTKGDVIVEINYKNPKNWNKLKGYYSELDIVRVYEVTVDKNINTKLEWFCLGEEAEVKAQLEQQRLDEIHLEKEKERLAKEAKENKIKKQQEYEADMIKLGKYKEYKILFNFKNMLIRSMNECFTLICLSETKPSRYEKIELKFNLKQLKCTENKLIKTLTSSYGIKYCHVLIDTEKTDEYYEVIKLGISDEETYDKRLYAKLCNII